MLLCRIPEEGHIEMKTLIEFISSVLNRVTSKRPSARSCLSADFFSSTGVHVKSLQLPWNKKEWKIHVSKVNAIDDVRGYLFDNNHDKVGDNQFPMYKILNKCLITGRTKSKDQEI